MGERNPQAKFLIVSIFLLGGIACGSWQRVGTDPTPDSSVLIPELFDPSLVYRRMGLITQVTPFPYVASIGFLAGENFDAAFGAFGISMSNSALSFRREGGRWEATYGVRLTFRDRSGNVVSELTDSQVVAVESLRETQRSDESVIYQRFMPLPAGLLSLSLEVEDRISGLRSRSEATVRVPRFSGTANISSLVPVYGVDVFRSSREIFPAMLLNPRATVRYGRDTLQLYLEAYGADNPVAMVRAVYAENGLEVWARRVQFDRTGLVAAVLIKVDPDSLPVGELRFEAVLEGTADTVTTAALIGFSNQWALSNFDDILSLLRYFTTREVIDGLRNAPVEERSSRWDRFWRATDPDQSTPQHEALEEYFVLIEQANRLFRQSGTPGWLTDRGEVFLTIGGPDETFEPFPDPASPLRVIQWSYTRHRITLQFVDQTGFGEFRLTDSSRLDMNLIQQRQRRGR